jgi:WD40 repeat protein
VTTGTTRAISTVAFSRVGHTLASGGADGRVQLWDITDPAHPQAIGQPLTSGHSGDVATAIAFSPDGHTLASVSLDGTIRLWNRPSTVLTSASDVEAVAFSPDGHTLASGSSNGTVRLWDVTDPAHPRPLSSP